MARKKTKTELLAELDALRGELVSAREENEALRQENLFFQAIMENVDDMIQVLNRDLTVRYTSPSVCKHGGWTPEDFQGKSIAEFYPSDTPTKMAEESERFWESEDGTLWNVEVECYDGRGGKVLLENAVTRVRSEPICGAVAVIRNITERTRQSKFWQKSDELVRTIFSQIKEGVVIHDQAGKIVITNDSMLRLFRATFRNVAYEYDAVDLYGLNKSKEFWLETWEKVSAGQPRVLDIAVPNAAKGKLAHLEMNLTPIEIDERKCILVVVHDVSERIRTETILKQSLAEKEALLRETHHRVKNNFAAISSLLRLQTRRVSDENVLRILKETDFRVKCMGLVHDKLHQSETLSEINVSDYLNSLLMNLMNVYGARERGIRLRSEIERVGLLVDTAIPLGFITSELVSNSLKHAFVDRNRGEVSVRLRHTTGPEYELLVTDDGVGMVWDKNVEELPSLGLNLVQSFVSQLEGKLRVVRDNGTQFLIQFKKPNGPDC